MKRKLLLVLMVVSILLVNNIAFAYDMEEAKGRLYGNWALVNGDFVKYKFDNDNVIIEDIEKFNDLVATYDVKLKTTDGYWYKAVVYVYSAASSNKLFMKFLRNDFYQDDTKSRFVKVDWDN